MKHLIKNILYGMGNVFVEIPARPTYKTLSRNGGFVEDRVNLRNDLKAIVGAIRKASYSKRIMEEVEYGKR